MLLGDFTLPQNPQKKYLAGNNQDIILGIIDIFLIHKPHWDNGDLYFSYKTPFHKEI